jgi:hypothetical protein
MRSPYSNLEDLLDDLEHPYVLPGMQFDISGFIDNIFRVSSYIALDMARSIVRDLFSRNDTNDANEIEELD